MLAARGRAPSRASVILVGTNRAWFGPVDMMQMTRQFRELFVDEGDLLAIVEAANTAFAVSRDRRLVFVNAPFRELGEHPEIAADVARAWQLGASVETVLGASEGAPILRAIDRVFETDQWVQLTCELGRDQGSQQVRASLFPIGVGDMCACLVTYANVVTVPRGGRGRAAERLVQSRYVDDNDYVKLCCECRLVQRAHGSAWDWVPELLDHPHPRTSHGMCDACYVRWVAAPR